MKTDTLIAEKIVSATLAVNDTKQEAKLKKGASKMAKEACKAAETAWTKARKASRKATKLARLARKRLERLEKAQKKSKSRPIVKRRKPKNEPQPSTVEGQSPTLLDFQSPSNPPN